MRSEALRLLRRLGPGLDATLRRGEWTQEWLVPRGLEKQDTNSFVPEVLVPFEDLAIDLAPQVERVRSWDSKGYRPLFEELRADDAINPYRPPPGLGYIDNGYYLTPDAEIYAAMILDFQPRRIVEVGSGYSTLIARRAVARMKQPCEIVVFDPQPRTNVQGSADRVNRSFVEDCAIADIPVDSSTLLFIDSSHLTRAGGDIPFLYNRLLPQLPAGTLVHVHDIYIPYDYPVLLSRPALHGAIRPSGFAQSFQPISDCSRDPLS